MIADAFVRTVPTSMAASSVVGPPEATVQLAGKCCRRIAASGLFAGRAFTSGG